MTVRTTKKNKRGLGVLHQKKDVQPWRHIPFVEGHYRLNYTLSEAFLSAFYLHNETLNIWTHFIGWALAFWWWISSLQTWLKDGNPIDKWIFSFFMISSQIQMLCSVSHHLVGCMSRPIYLISARLDYSAIALLLPSGSFALIHYVLYCDSLLAWIYHFLNTFFGFVVLGLCWWPIFQTPDYQKFRAVAFTSLGLFCLVPWFTGFWLYPELLSSQALLDHLFVGFVMGIGVTVYISRFPERLNPGKFDCCQSHVLWHVFVILGNIGFYWTIESLYKWRLQRPC